MQMLSHDHELPCGYNAYNTVFSPTFVHYICFDLNFASTPVWMQRRVSSPLEAEDICCSASGQQAKHKDCPNTEGYDVRAMMRRFAQ